MTYSKTYTCRRGRLTATLCAFFAVAFAVTSTLPRGASAQSARIVHQIVKQKTVPPTMGRDLWLALPQNYLDQAGKYFYLYVTSPGTATVHVETSAGIMVQIVQPYKVAAFNLPLGWEVKTNDVVEPKGIHVWAKEADITVYLMSHNPYTSDGAYIIPTIGLGNDYVVGAFASLDAAAYSDGDEPSEFVLVATHDNTNVTITCPNPLRGATPYSIGHQAGETFSVVLNKGETIQEKAPRGIDVELEDVTGTVIHSDYPIGVLAGSQCPFIPLGIWACDHVVDMMPPTRTWAKTYYTAPFIGRNGGDTFLLLGTKDGQKIYRTDAVGGKKTYCYLSKNGALPAPFWENSMLTASKWESDTSFFLVQYMNGAQWDNPSDGTGDPAEVVINPLEQYSKTVVFQTPTSQGSQSPYKNYVNVIVNETVSNTTTFDGKKITSFPKLPIDNIYADYRISGVPPGTHVVKSDSGVGVYVYGYGTYESYAWAGSFGTGTYHSPDTIPPLAMPTGVCYDAHVNLLDSGLFQSKLQEIRVDTIGNMAFNLDPDWKVGLGIPSSFYDMFVVDPTQPAILQVSVFDVAGNQTTITSTYIPQIARIGPPIQNFGVGNLGGAPIYQYDTLTNTGSMPFSFQTLKFVNGDSSGFAIDSADTKPLAVGESRLIKISFLPRKSAASYDTLIFGDSCKLQPALVVGTGGGADFQITNYDYGNVIVKDATNSTGFTVSSPAGAVQGQPGTLITNLSLSPVTIDSIWADKPEFASLGPVNITIPPSKSVAVSIAFKASQLGVEKSPWHARSSTLDKAGLPIGTRDATLTANVQMPGQVFLRDTTITRDCSQPGDVVHIIDTIRATGTYATNIVHLAHSATDSNWTNFKALYGGRLVNPDSAIVSIESNGSLVVQEDFQVPMATNGTFSDEFTAVTSNNDTLRVRARVIVTYRAGTVSPAALNFPRVPYKGAAPPAQTVTLTNTTTSDLTVSSLSFLLSTYAGAYTVTPDPQYLPLPYVLKAGQSMTAQVSFNPAVSFDSVQDAKLTIGWDACNTQPPMAVVGGASVAGDVISGYTPTPILACSLYLDSVVVTNTKPSVTGDIITDTVVDVQIMGVDSLLFSLQGGAGAYLQKTIIGGDSLPILLLFNPSNTTPSIAAAKTYNVVVRVILRNNRTDAGSKTIDTVYRTIQGIAQGLQVAASSAFVGADQNIQADNGYEARLPVNVAVTGLSAQVGSLGINTVKLTYLFDADLLDIRDNDFASHFTGNQGWTVNAAGTKLVLDSRRTGATPNTPAFLDTLYLMLTNATPLDDKTPSLGTINFRIALSYHDSTTAITMDSIKLFAGANAVPGCVATSVGSGTFQIVYRCGNEVLMAYMNGNTAPIFFTKPATPDPVRGGVVAISYAVRGQSHISLAIYDLLGNEVVRPLDNVMQEAGSWQINCDISKLASGTYTYRLTDGHASISKQFVIQR